MVNYDSLSVGLKVDFLVENSPMTGVVRYKGPLNGKVGNWVGVEASQPVGFCNGTIEGRYYFKCPKNCGLFLTADELRLTRTLTPKPRSLYKSIESECDDLLFRKSEPKDYIVCITEDYLERAKTSFEKSTFQDIFAPAHRYASRETLFPPKVKKIAQKKIETSSSATFQPVSSISKTYMPTEELELYTKLAWSHKNIKSLPRCNSKSNKTFDSFNMNRSNYIEPDVNKK